MTGDFFGSEFVSEVVRRDPESVDNRKLKRLRLLRKLLVNDPFFKIFCSSRAASVVSSSSSSDSISMPSFVVFGIFTGCSRTSHLTPPFESRVGIS